MYTLHTGSAVYAHFIQGVHYMHSTLHTWSAMFAHCTQEVHYEHIIHRKYVHICAKPFITKVIFPINPFQASQMIGSRLGLSKQLLIV